MAGLLTREVQACEETAEESGEAEDAVFASLDRLARYVASNASEDDALGG
jgi:hypothetical protein